MMTINRVLPVIVALIVGGTTPAFAAPFPGAVGQASDAAVKACAGFFSSGTEISALQAQGFERRGRSYRVRVDNPETGRRALISVETKRQECAVSVSGITPFPRKQRQQVARGHAEHAMSVMAANGFRIAQIPQSNGVFASTVLQRGNLTVSVGYTFSSSPFVVRFRAE